MCVERLTAMVRTFLDKTGEDALLVLLQDDEERPTGVHLLGWTPQVGLLVDGKPATLGFYQGLQDFRPLQDPPSVLH